MAAQYQSAMKSVIGKIDILKFLWSDMVFVGTLLLFCFLLGTFASGDAVRRKLDVTTAPARP